MDSVRLQKLEELRKRGVIPYASSFERSHTLKEGEESKEGTSLKVAGRIVLWRDMGKVTFATLQDHTGRLQLLLRDENLGESYKTAMKMLDLGDFIGVEGKRVTTKTGEPTVEVTQWTMLSKALSQPPEKWHGVVDRETIYRQRYLDTMSNRESFERFLFRSNFIRAMREFYWSEQFVEVDLPVLVNAASGALATPFTTHHEALDLDVFLRIALETHQKECLVGGFDRTFSLGPVFRNEGMDPSHLQEFTMCEHYAAYWDFRKNMEFTERMFQYLGKHVPGMGTTMKIPDRDGNLQDVDFRGPWPKISMRDLIKGDSGIDIDEHATADDLRKEMKEKKITLEVDVSKLGRGNLIDQLYKKVSRPKIVKPTFVTNHPLDLSPLARRNDENPAITDRFQLVVGGWEIVNAYSELVDPVDQMQRFEDQSKAKAGGDADAHAKDDEYVEALSYGCPPCSGWGMGVDRIVTLLTAQENLRDVVLFPIMKPLQEAKKSKPDGKQKMLPAQDSSHELPSPHGMLLQSAEYGHLLPAAHGLVETHATLTKAHLLATGAAMEALAKKLGGHPETWKVAGMLHDLDWDSLDKDFERHCGEELAGMLASINAPEELLGDIRAHYAHRYGADYPLDSMLRRALYCVDELTGFIIAVTYVRPSKKIADVEVSSVKKKLKDKGFAAQVDRSQIGKCEELLGLPLDEFIGITLHAMKAIGADLGL